MSKFQNDREVFYGICKFFSSNAWWRPIMEFIYSNSRVFEHSFQYSTEEEHIIYIKFMNMITDLVDNYMCSKLHITSDAFENFMVQFLAKPNEKATVIFDTLKQATNYNEFCKQMHLCNVRIENSITRALLKYSEDESIKSTDELAVFVAKQIEKDQNIEIEDLVHKACVQTKKMMGINVLNSKKADPKEIISTPTKLDSKIKSSLNVSINKNDDEIKTQNEVKDSNQKLNKEKCKKHKHSHHSHRSQSKSNKSSDQNENTENVINDTKEKADENDSTKIKSENSNDLSKNIQKDDRVNDDKNKANTNKNSLNTNKISDIKVDGNDESSDISELSEEEEEESDSLIVTLKKNQFLNKNKISLNRSFMRPPIIQRNRMSTSKNKMTNNNQQKNSNVSIVFDSP